MLPLHGGLLMARIVKHRNGWGRTPREGTIRNEIFRTLLRPQGLSSYEARILFGAGNLSGTIDYLRDFCGFDVRSFADKSRHYSTRAGRKAKCPVIYKIVGRHKWNGGYVSFVRAEDY